jgi:hypothetical protein
VAAHVRYGQDLSGAVLRRNLARIEGRAGEHVPSTSGTLSDQPTACRNRRLRRLTGGLVSWGPERRSASPNNVRYWHSVCRHRHHEGRKSGFVRPSLVNSRMGGFMWSLDGYHRRKSGFEDLRRGVGGRVGSTRRERRQRGAVGRIDTHATPENPRFSTTASIPHELSSFPAASPLPPQPMLACPNPREIQKSPISPRR